MVANSPLKFNTRFNPAKVAGFQTLGASRTDQSFAEDSDINELVRRFIKRGSLYDPATLMNRTPSQPTFGDFSNIPDLLDAANQIVEAERMFGQLPAMIREFFNHDALSLLRFVEMAKKDENLYQKGVELGLLRSREEEAGAGTAVPANAKQPEDPVGKSAPAGNSVPVNP